MKDFDPSRPNLELSHGELKSLHGSLSKVLVIRGEITENPGIYPPEGKANPYNFTYVLPKNFVRDVFYPSGNGLIVGSGSYISYSTPHRIEQEDDGEVDSIFLSLETRIAETDITCSQSILLMHANGDYEASFDTEYLGDGRRISPNNLPPGTGVYDNESVDRLLEDVSALERPLDLDDAENLRKIEELIVTS